jgi:hypothetical protein
MARRRARIIPRRRGNARPTSPRGPQGPSRGRPAPRGRGRPAPRGRGRPTARGRGSQGPLRGRPTSPRGPQGRKSSGAVSSMQELLRRQKETGGVIRGGPRGPRGPQGPRSKATSRPTINPGQGLRKFIDTMPKAIDTMPRAPRAGGPQGPRRPNVGIQLANQNAMQRQMEAALGSQAGRGTFGRGMRGPQGPMRAQQDRNFARIPQRPIPNRDGRMAQMQADLAREASRANAAAARGRPTTPRPMPPSNYMRQMMAPQQLQRGMGRGPMPRANIGQVQAPRPTFGQQMRSPLPRRRR